MFDFTDQVIVVSGAAGNLGRAVVKAFIEAGGTICALDHRQGRLAEFKNANPDKMFLFENADITDREGMIRLAEEILAIAGKVDVVVNTVGGFTAGDRVDQLSYETWQKMMNVNVLSLLNIAAAFVPGMIERSYGKFITIGSRSSLKGGGRVGAYAAAKASVLRMSESMSEELKSSNIQVNCVLPGTIDTPENREALPNADRSGWVSPEQVAGVIRFLASPEADGISGAAVPVYGG
jgi:NAD(P)-dependent dehydrogenase (short-subunit alcohol dehydrogenase family)